MVDSDLPVPFENCSIRSNRNITLICAASQIFVVVTVGAVGPPYRGVHFQLTINNGPMQSFYADELPNRWGNMVQRLREALQAVGMEASSLGWFRITDTGNVVPPLIPENHN